MRESVARWVVWGRLYAFRGSATWSCGQMGALKIENGMIYICISEQVILGCCGGGSLRDGKVFLPFRSASFWCWQETGKGTSNPRNLVSS